VNLSGGFHFHFRVVFCVESVLLFMIINKTHSPASSSEFRAEVGLLVGGH
jgi:hypothetical protein